MSASWLVRHRRKSLFLEPREDFRSVTQLLMPSRLLSDPAEARTFQSPPPTRTHHLLHEIRGCGRRALPSIFRGCEQTVEVTADTLYEAVAQGLRVFREQDWVNDIGWGQTTISVVVRHPVVEHKVRVQDFERWSREVGACRSKP